MAGDAAACLDDEVLRILPQRTRRTATEFTEDLMIENELSGKAIGAAISVHKALGPGLLESAYQECLYYELQKLGLAVDKEKPLPLVYENVKLECGYRVDLLVENRLIIEVKIVDALNDVHLAQVLYISQTLSMQIRPVDQLQRGVAKRWDQTSDPLKFSPCPL
jgi:GxxExxY protein